MFTATVGGTALPGGLGRWNGTGWESVAGGPNGEVWALASDPTGLLIGGSFNATVDGTMDLHNWTVLGPNGSQPVPTDPEMPTVRGFHRLPGGRLLVGASIAPDNGIAATLVVDGGTVQRMDHFGVRAGHQIADATVLFGIGGMELHRDVRLMGRYVDGRLAITARLNDVNAVIEPSPIVFRNGPGPGFEVPAGGTAHSILRASPGMLAHVGDVRHASFPAYYDGAGPEWPDRPWAGPHALVMDDGFYERYHQVWQVDRAEVQHHATHWNDPGHVVPQAIATWPGNGDVSNGEPAMLAPFKDINGNGTYEPHAGDHPVFRGDRCVYSITHTAQDSFEGDPPLKLDTHTFHHVYDSPPGSPMDQTVLVQYWFINRGTEVYEQVRFGQYVDLEIGCEKDDLAGCDTTRHRFFAYNGYDVDPVCYGSGYGPQPPAQVIKFLNVAMRSHSVLHGHWPATIEDLMYGLYMGAPLSVAGWPDHFWYPGGEYADSGPEPDQADRRSIGATGPFTLAPGDTLCIDLAFIFARAPSGGAYASV